MNETMEFYVDVFEGKFEVCSKDGKITDVHSSHATYQQAKSECDAANQPMESEAAYWAHYARACGDIQN